MTRVAETKRPTALWLTLLSAAYFLSGFCALVYQAAWIRMFSRVFGSTVFAMSVVLAVFFGGLALGSHYFGRVSVRARNPVRLYGGLEAAVGLYVLAFPWILGAAERFYSAVYPAVYQEFGVVLAIRAVVSLAVLIVPTVLMGGTLPVLSRHFVRGLAQAGPRAGLVYGLNAVGAAIGSLLTGFVLIRALGVSGAHALAGAVNLALGVAALLISAKTSPAGTFTEEVATGHETPGTGASQAGTSAHTPRTIALVIGCFALSGFVSMAYELVWLRYLVLYFRDTIYLYTAIITAFVLGIGAGSLAISGHASAMKRPVRVFALLQAGIGLFTIIAVYLPVPFYQKVWDLGETSSLWVLALVFALLLPPTLLMGATFPVVTRVITIDVRTVGRRIGTAYALNMIGSILGSLAGGFILFNTLGLQWTLCLLFGANMVMAALLLSSEQGASGANRWAWTAPVVLAVAFSLVSSLPEKGLPKLVLERKLPPNTRILAIREGISGTTWAVKESDSSTTLWEGSVRISGTTDKVFLVQGFIPMLLTPDVPERVLGLAFGGGLSYYAARLFPEVERMDFVDMSRANIEVSLDYFPENSGLKTDPRANFIIDDAYNYTKHIDKTYDLILMEPTPPMFSFRTAALYTREFYAQAKERLSEDGVFAQVLPLEHMSFEESMGVMKTFSTVFDHALLWWNHWDCVMMGKATPFRIDVQEVAERLSRPYVRRPLRDFSRVSGYENLGNLLSGLLLTTGDFREAAAPGTLYTDDHPGLEFSTGRNITLENLRRIHDHLTPFKEAVRVFANFGPYRAHIPELDSLRENFLTLHYKEHPREYYSRYMSYIRKHSRNKAADLEYLLRYLIDHGMTEEAREVRSILRGLGTRPPAR